MCLVTGSFHKHYSLLFNHIATIVFLVVHSTLSFTLLILTAPHVQKMVTLESLMDIWILLALCLMNSTMVMSNSVLMDNALTEFCYDGGKGDLTIPDYVTER